MESSKAIASAALAVFLVASGDEMAAAAADMVAASMQVEAEWIGPGGAGQGTGTGGTGPREAREPHGPQGGGPPLQPGQLQGPA